MLFFLSPLYCLFLILLIWLTHCTWYLLLKILKKKNHGINFLPIQPPNTQNYLSELVKAKWFKLELLLENSHICLSIIHTNTCTLAPWRIQNYRVELREKKQEWDIKFSVQLVEREGSDAADGEQHILLEKDPTADEKMSWRAWRAGRGGKGRKADPVLILIFCQGDW